MLRHLARIEPGDVGRVGRRHHHRAHAIGAERIHRHRQYQRRIDAAGQADDRARETVLADVVAHTGDKRAPRLRLERQRRRNLAARAAVAVEFDEREALVEHRRARRQLAACVERERRAVEHDLVLPADEVREQQGQPDAARALRHALLPLFGLVDVEGRRIEHRQHLRPGRLRQLRRLVEPRVLADQHAELEAAGLEHQRALPGVTARGEIAVLVEHLVVGQLALAVGGEHMSPRQHRGRIAAQRHTHRLGPNIAAFTELMRMTHHHVQALAIGQLTRHVGERLLAGQHEGRAQQQILRRVAAQAQLGGQHDARAGRMSLPRHGNDLASIAGQVADMGVELGQRDLGGSGHR